MKPPRRIHSFLASILLVTSGSLIPSTTPLQAQRAGADYYDTLFTNALTWTLNNRRDDLPVLNMTPPWERVWETKYTFFPRIRLTDSDGTVWEAVLNPHAVQAIVVAPDSTTLAERVDILFAGQFQVVWLNLLDFVKSAQIPIRGFVPEDPGSLSHETFVENVRDFVRYPASSDMNFADPIVVGLDSLSFQTINPSYGLGNIWQGVVNLAPDTIPGYWVDYLVKVAHAVYKVEGHNPPEDDCIKLSNCMLFCDRKR